MISNLSKRKILDSLSTFDYEKIILFGSRAREDFNEYSDYDLLIVLKQTSTIQEKMIISKKIRQLLATESIDADVLIKNKTDIDYFKDKIGSVIHNALLEGIQL